MQTNKNRVQGKFIGYVMGRAIPGGLVMFVNVMLFYFVYTYTEIPMTQAQYETLGAIALTLGGWVVLCQICRPFNTFRAIVFGMVSVIILFVLFVDLPIFKTILELGTLSDMIYADNWTNLLLLTTLVTLDFPLLSGLIAAVEKARNYLSGVEQRRMEQRRDKAKK